MEHRQRIVFVGAGHAHLHSLKRCRAFIDAGHECVLVAPGDFWYSGLATGVVGGQYPIELDRIDAGTLVERAGARFISGRVTRLDPHARRLMLAGGGELEYDVVSLNVGSQPPPIEGEDEHAGSCFAAKPVAHLCRLRDDLTARITRGDRPPRLVVAGGGPTAFELTANALGLAERLGKRLDVTIVATGSRMLPQLPSRGAGAVVDGLKRRGLRLISGRKVVRITAGGVTLDDESNVACELFINATGLRPSPLAKHSGLATDDEGAMIVDRHLCSTSDARVFGGGDFVCQQDARTDKVGVHAIRQAPVLFENLLAALNGHPPQRIFRPQEKYLWIMNLGDGTAMAARGRLWYRGRLALWLKDWIDRRFLRSMAPS